MSAPTVFVVKNQTGQFLSKQQEWIDGGDRQALYRTAHRDEAINTVFEVSSKDIYLRAEAIACPVDSKGQPLPQGADLLTQDETVDNAPADNGANDVEPVPEEPDSPEEPLKPVLASDELETMEASVEAAGINA